MKLYREPIRRLLSLLFICFIAGTTASVAFQQDGVSVQQGPTPIPNGDALGETDLTMQNEHIALSFAVETGPPWGVARGGILDLAIIRDGEFSEDLVSLMDFMPDNWSSWPSSYQTVTVVEDGPERGVIRTERDWRDVELITTFTLNRGEMMIHVETEMINAGGEPLEDLLSGYVLWADGGYFFNRPGFEESDGFGAEYAMTDWAGSYEEEWSLVFHAPFADYVGYDGQDQYRQHTLHPGKTRTFEGWLQVIDDGTVQPALVAESERKGRPAGRVEGVVTDETGETVPEPIVVVESEGIVYSWDTGENGSYGLDLPEGAYTLYAVSEGFSAGTSAEVQVEAGQTVQINFSDLKRPGELLMDVREADSGNPLDVNVRIADGPSVPVEYLGRPVFFSDLEQIGSLSARLSPGSYTIEISHGAGFVSKALEKELVISPGEKKSLEIDLPVMFDPAQQNWYAADLHHHSDILDGATPPRQVLQAQLSAGLNLAFLSDHDSPANHAVMDSLAATRNVAFIPSMEVSPSWGHFNIFPLDLEAELTIDPTQATSTEIYEDARRMGADLVSVNHPYISYGYFHSLEEGTVEGGFDPGFDLVEINIVDDYDRVMERMFSFWNRGMHVYLAAGSDTHDVWTGTTGRMRIMVHSPAGPTLEGFTEGLKHGHSYTTMGPLIRPAHPFGSQLRVNEGESVSLPFTLQSVHGLKSITLIGNGEVIETRNLADAGHQTDTEFQPVPSGRGWYSVIVEDAEGNRAFSNPIWVLPVQGKFE